MDFVRNPTLAPQLEKTYETPQSSGDEGLLFLLMQRVDSLEKTLMLGEIGGSRRRGQQRMRWLDGITDSMDERLAALV